MGRIGLLACSKSKLGAETPDRLVPAQDIYQGRTFKRAKSEGLKMYGCEDWFILSGKADYNLLDKDAEIKYYDVYLGKPNSVSSGLNAREIQFIMPYS